MGFERDESKGSGGLKNKRGAMSLSKKILQTKLICISTIGAATASEALKERVGTSERRLRMGSRVRALRRQPKGALPGKRGAREKKRSGRAKQVVHH